MCRRHTVVGLSVCLSVASVSRRSLKTKALKQATPTGIDTHSDLNLKDSELSSRVMDLLTLLAVGGDLDFFEDKTGYLMTNVFVCTTEQRGVSEVTEALASMVMS